MLIRDTRTSKVQPRFPEPDLRIETNGETMMHSSMESEIMQEAKTQSSRDRSA
jgi:hypothetical protein